MDPKTATVLIAESDAPTTALLRQTLRGLGFKQVQTAPDGYAAVLVCKRTKVDMLIVDWDLPRLTGEEILRYLRRAPHFERPATIMLVNDVSRETLQKMASLRVDDCLVKPIGAQTIAQKVSRVAASRSSAASSKAGAVAQRWTPGKG